VDDRTEPLEGSGKQLADSAKTIARTTEKVQTSTERVEDSADRRTQLAGDRRALAAERTYAAWVRTGLFAFASGLGAKALLEDVLPAWLTIMTGIVMLLFAAFCFLAGVWRDIRPVRAPPRTDVRTLPPALLVVINGFLALVALSAIVAIAFG
jgi:putative membrane protein